LVVIDAALLILALYFIQEGEAQRAHPNLWFFVDFPTKLLPLAYAAAILMIPNLAVTALTLIRNLYRRRWPWVTTLVAAILLSVIIAMIGWSGVGEIIKPGGW
jgi:4-amino-4-deoxy-L-arabinose transferase-like glycosyltransferase